MNNWVNNLKKILIVQGSSNQQRIFDINFFIQFNIYKNYQTKNKNVKQDLLPNFIKSIVFLNLK